MQRSGKRTGVLAESSPNQPLSFFIIEQESNPVSGIDQVASIRCPVYRPRLDKCQICYHFTLPVGHLPASPVVPVQRKYCFPRKGLISIVTRVREI